MSYYADQLEHHHHILDEFAEARSEMATIRRPPRAGAIRQDVSVQGVFAPSPNNSHDMTTLGIKAPLNGVFYVRVVHLPPELGDVTKENSEAMPPGWTLTVRGRTMRVTRAIKSDGEVLFGLQDELEG